MKMRISKRICSVKGHTIGYVIGGQRVTRGAAVKLARRNHIAGVVARQQPNGRWYITSAPGRVTALYDLPTVVEN